MAQAEVHAICKSKEASWEMEVFSQKDKKMNNVLRQFLAGVLAGGITSGTAVVTLLQDTLLTAISGGEWVSIGIGGFVAAAAGWKTLLTEARR
jgi:hypothetical protein